MGQPTPEEMSDGAGRVELYKCTKCSIDNIRFPRFHSKPETLLRTRRGRCGEWANCFVLCCRALGFDTRHVLDWTDHVWAEVWSEAESCWLHVDPGETMDKPLVYEAGWGKKLTYVIAFSKDEVQDVTWRYSKDHSKTKQRRQLVRPKWLVKTILTLSRTRTNKLAFSEEKVKLLTERRLAECLEMLTPRQVSDGDKMGRQTGSRAWRLARGELGDSVSGAEWVWTPSDTDLAAGVMTVQYDVVQDKYYHGDTVIDTFAAGTWKCSNISRKVESDWNMVYLARVEANNNPGTLEWKFQMRDNYVIVRIVVTVESTCFHGGRVVWQMCNDQVCLVPTSGVSMESTEFAGAKEVKIILGS